MTRWRILAFAAVFILVGTQVLAQQQATVKRNMNLRPTPSTAEAEIRTLAPPEVVTLLDPDPIEGYYRIRRAAGRRSAPTSDAWFGRWRARTRSGARLESMGNW